MLIGSHVSISGGLLGAVEESLSYGSNTFMVYTGAPQNTVRKPLEAMKIDEGKKLMSENNITEFVVHAPYIINLASFKENIFELAVSFLNKEIKRTTAFGAKYIVLHPGVFTAMDVEYGINRIAEGLNMVINSETSPIICLETMSGKGSEIGRNFEELSQIINLVNHNEKLGICFDTCHTHDSGYDIVNNFDDVINEFDKTLGLDRLKVFHINGSLNTRGAKKDRHANIGADENNLKGEDNIGFDALYNIVHHTAAKGRPLILETPWLDKKTNLYKQEISLLRGGKK